jgi:hypothetical protein
MPKIFTCIDQVSNIFKAPNKKSEVVSQILFGEEFFAKKTNNQFYKGYSAFDEYSGFVLKKKFKIIPAEKKYRITIKKASLFSGPNLLKKTKKELLFNSKVCIQGEKNHFIKIGKFWIKKNSIKKINNISNNFLQKIKYFSKTKYLWGGNSIKGIDCSGLVQELLKSANKKCPRDSKDQLAFFKKSVSLSGIKKGDLLFWKGHVAIALSKQSLVHAYGPKKKVVVMPIKKTIKMLLETKNLKILSIKRPL